MIDDVFVNNETSFMMNLKIKSIHFFKGVHRDRVCIHMFIRVSNHTYISIYACVSQ
jgi:hypothetical protein